MSSSRSTGTSVVADTETNDATGTSTGFEEQHPLAEAGHEATQATGRIVDRATSIGYERADEGRHRIADGLDQVATRVRGLSTDMEDQQPAIASVATTAADGAERLAHYLHNTDAREMMSNVENLARRQPILFLGAAFVAGVAIARVLKAAGGDDGSQRGAHASGYGPYTPGAASAYEPTGPGGTGGDR